MKLFIAEKPAVANDIVMYGQEGWTTFTENSAVVLYYPPKSKNALWLRRFQKRLGCVI
ncbi:hypothetical protein [Escherichia coli]|uniref:hypothetical protein n=1 Tax=Escherichia coli TaxID=562 RepID=UPI003B59C204